MKHSLRRVALFDVMAEAAGSPSAMGPRARGMYVDPLNYVQEPLIPNFHFPAQTGLPTQPIDFPSARPKPPSPEPPTRTPSTVEPRVTREERRAARRSERRERVEEGRRIIEVFRADSDDADLIARGVTRKVTGGNTC